VEAEGLETQFVAYGSFVLEFPLNQIRVRAFATGELLWTQPANPTHPASVALDDDHCAVFSDGHVRRLHMATGGEAGTPVKVPHLVHQLARSPSGQVFALMVEVARNRWYVGCVEWRAPAR
jgi:hypothetical protein